MIIHLKRQEKLYLNGAVIRLDRRGAVELMNDAHFLLESHIMQAESAKTPLRELYFIVQMMLMDPENSNLTNCLFLSHIEKLEARALSQGHGKVLTDAKAKVAKGHYFEALKLLRLNFNIDDGLTSIAAATEGQRQKEVA